MPGAKAGSVRYGLVSDRPCTAATGVVDGRRWTADVQPEHLHERPTLMSDFFLHTHWTPEQTRRAYEELDRTRRQVEESTKLLPPLPRGSTSGGIETTLVRY